MSRTVTSARPICLYDTDKDFTLKKKDRNTQKKEKDNYLHPSRKPTILPIQEGCKTFPKRETRRTRQNTCVDLKERHLEGRQEIRLLLLG